MSDEDKKAAGKDALLGCAVVIPLLLPFLLWQAYVVATLWGWFVVPLFPVPALNTVAAYGLLATWGAVKMNAKKTETRKSTEYLSEMVVTSLALALSLGFAALVRWWAL